MVIKEVKEHIKMIEGLDEVVEVDTITRFDIHGNVISHSDDAGNSVEINIEYYEQGWGKTTPPIKTKTVKTKFLNKLTEMVLTEYTIDGKKMNEKGTIYDNTKDYSVIRQTYKVTYNTDGVCNYEKLRTVRDESTNETFTITAKLPSEVEHADNKGLDNVWYFVDKNNLITRTESYDDKGRLIRLEDYPNNKMYVYGYYEDTKKLLSHGIFTIIDNKIIYIEDNKFDDNGRVVYSEVTSYEDATNTQNWLKYNDSGDCISHSEVISDLSGESSKPPKTIVTRCKYDDKHHILESVKGYETHTYSYSYYE